MTRRNPYLRSSVLWAIVVNVLALALLFLGLELRRGHQIQTPPPVEPVRATVVDATALQAAEEARRKAEAERKRKAAEEARR
ncbi:MAG TPA: hypothetical protein ENK53_08930, partial [Thiotrichales bacterium]|nr:hypothetical protein [Thiotrichales bacterium]